MTGASSQAVRQPLQPRRRSGRALDQRLALRFPGLARRYTGFLLKRSPRSRLRMEAVRRLAELTIDAFNRRDLNAVLAGTDPGFEYCPERSWVEAGLVDARYVGLAGYKHYIATVDEVWGGQNFLTPVEVIDLGDRFAMFADAQMRAQASGVPLSQEYAAIVTVKDGAAIRLQEYFDHGRALEALGLPPKAS